VKRFRFQLEQLLRLKHWREEEAKKALAEEVMALEKLQARLAELQGEMTSVLDADRGGAGPDVDFRGRLGILQYARHLGDLISSQHEDISQQGERLKEKSDLLLKAMQERKVLEKLKEKRFEEYRLERKRFEYANLDEASAGFLQRKAGADRGSASAENGLADTRPAVAEES
jgi:flagellar FliJ protein